MQETMVVDPSSSAGSFAGLMASLAALKETTEASREDPLDAELADDVATLSYESALRMHARRQAKAGESGPMAGPADAGGDGGTRPEAGILTAAPRTSKSRGSGRRGPHSFAGMGMHSGSGPAVANEGEPARAERKVASITVRMSEEECQRLRERAAEAGITVSAYLRSCAFEVEDLRSQVKQALAELRSGNHAAERRKGRNWLTGGWMKHLWPGRRDVQDEASTLLTA